MKLEKTQWLSFGVTTTMAFAVYFLTLAPDVGLRNSGYFSVAAMYGGVPMPAGFPFWTVWAWGFTEGLPFSNIHWRAALATAFAAALACGIIALIVCRVDGAILETLGAEANLAPNEQNWLRAVCGYTAGMAFGVNEAFWPLAITADPLPFNILLQCVILWLLIRWSEEPTSKCFLYAAACIYGALLADSQIELALAPAIPFFVALHQREIGRDLLLAATGFFIGGIGLKATGHFVVFPLGGAHFFYISIGVATALTGIGLMIRTRRAFSEWRTVLLCFGATTAGSTACLYLPMASMTNPPANWGYARSVPGFFETLSRGQYNRIEMTSSAARFWDELGQYFFLTSNQFGWFYLIIALFPLLILSRLGAAMRRRIFGLIVIYIFLAFLVLVVLNPTRDRQAQELLPPYLTISYPVLAVLTGCGLIIIGIGLTKGFRTRLLAGMGCYLFLALLGLNSYCVNHDRGIG